MMGIVPLATPQTFSRIVVLPALALPITRTRKCGQLNCSLSASIYPSWVPDMHQSNVDVKSPVVGLLNGRRPVAFAILNRDFK